MIDLRSDTVSRPTPAMRQAIAEAEVGDDVFGDDPTVNELERVTAHLLGKAAAMFVPSGTMANQIAVRLHTQAGDAAVVEAGSHVYNAEAGGAAALSGVTCRTVVGRRGIFGEAELAAACQPPDIHHAPARLVCVENTHNAGGGSVWPVDALDDLSAAAHARGLRLHMDGARLWNASAASGVPERRYADCCDSVSVCFSKGLGAPVGSALAGPADFVARGRRFRKMFGGGMRQAGLLAAGALYALRHHRQRLHEDHANAARLAAGLAQMEGVDIDAAMVETNIVRFKTPGQDAGAIAKVLLDRGVAMIATGPESLRAVTHLMVNAADIEEALGAIREVLAKRPPADGSATHSQSSSLSRYAGRGQG
jgi:threonine aldolase